MKTTLGLQLRKPHLAFAVATVLAASAATAQVATGDAARTADTGGNYRLEVQACKSGQTGQDRVTCLEEARNAQAARQRGTLHNGASEARYEANAKARCEVFKDAEDKAACEARVMGFGSSSGSVAGGGVLREVETVVLPPGQDEVTIEPKTSDPVVLVPVPATRIPAR